ncbi:MAG: ABC transporter permease [Deltaproteobacteria bacterium]|nr:ABC transporter permease [Deltaproteobacteria bacterium]
MPAPSRPSVFTGIAVVARIALARLTRGKAFYVSIGLLILPIAIATMVKRPGTSDAFQISILALTLQPLILFIPALHCAGMLADELDDRTYTYLFTHPIPRWTLVAGKLLTTYLVLLVGFTLSVLAQYQVFKSGGMPRFLDDGRNYGLPRVLVATSIGLLGSCCLAAAAGAVFPRRPFAAVFAWILGVEFIIGNIPTVLARVSLGSHIRRVAWGLIGEQKVGMPSVSTSTLRLLELAALFLAIGIWRLSRAEYRSEV